MLNKIDGQSYLEMIDYGLRNLSVNCDMLNKLNVFPVPDGDTGTNMVLTLKNGLSAVPHDTHELSVVAKKFANSVVFGARGNSGVIMSQFLKGVSEQFFDVAESDTVLFVKGPARGVECSYAAVANPVEGTMLTVVKDSAAAVRECTNNVHSINDVVVKSLKAAKLSLDNTPKLLPTLKNAGVVDSGGAGIVCFFDGVKKYLDGEPIDAIETALPTQNTDFSRFDKDSKFEYGYCTELLIQLLNGKEPFEFTSFKQALSFLGDSVAISFDVDKVRIHIHTHTPEEVFAFCHRYGEFLLLKVENMSVQHAETVQNIMCSENLNNGKFSVVAVAYDREVQKLFLDMGADVVILCDKSASAKDYIDAFENVDTEEILVFPNSSDSTLSALQAKNLYSKAKVTVINSRFTSECYASLPIIDFDADNVDKVVDTVSKTISNLYTVSVSHRTNTTQYNGKTVTRKEYYAFSGKEIIAISKTLDETVVATVQKAIKLGKAEIMTVFYDKSVSDEQLDALVASVEQLEIVEEIFTVPCENPICDLIISFE